MDGTHDLPQISTPNIAPAAGRSKLYIGLDGRLYVIQSTGIALPVGNELCVDNGTQNLTVAIASQALFTKPLFMQMRAKLIAGAGAGAYVCNFFLSTPASAAPLAMLPGASLKLLIELPASAHPTITIYDTSTGGTLLKTIVNPNSNPAIEQPPYWCGFFGFGEDSHWHFDTGLFQI